MANVREIITNWSLVGRGGMKTVMYFNAATAVATQRTALQAFWTSIKAFQASTTLYDIDIAGRELDMATGALTGAWSEPSVKNGFGTNGAQAVADASMALIQWQTGVIVGRRFLRGRTFVPGLGIAQLSQGNLLGTTATAFVNYGATLASSGASFVIWHRPIAGSGGNMQSPAGVTCWSEMAVLRRRRG